MFTNSFYLGILLLAQFSYATKLNQRTIQFDDNEDNLDLTEQVQLTSEERSNSNKDKHSFGFMHFVQNQGSKVFYEFVETAETSQSTKVLLITIFAILTVVFCCCSVSHILAFSKQCNTALNEIEKKNRLNKSLKPQDQTIQ